MTQATIAHEQDFDCRRARIMSGIRSALNTTAAVALILTFAGLGSTAAIGIGIACGLVAAARARRVGVFMTANGIVVTNYFRTYIYESLNNSTLHFYFRNRTEIETENRRIRIQAASLFEDDVRQKLRRECVKRGATFHDISTRD